MRIEVTAEDLEKGKRFRSDGCAVWLALNRQTEGVCAGEGWLVDDGGIFVGDAILSHRSPAVWFPAFVTRRIHTWDEGEPVQPFAFDIDLSPLLEVAKA